MSNDGIAFRFAIVGGQTLSGNQGIFFCRILLVLYIAWVFCFRLIVNIYFIIYLNSLSSPRSKSAIIMIALMFLSFSI